MELKHLVGICRLIAIQAFMNRHKVKVCWEVDGRLYKGIENAPADKEKIEHTLNAGIRTKPKK